MFPAYILSVMLKMPTIQGINEGSREMFETMNRAITAIQLHPVIDRVYRITNDGKLLVSSFVADHEVSMFTLD
ncbi:hypothetical protein [Paenibacillus fonticola]|uniref:hypothetical protein n=1 Tax=Paenibacillus fonticola TaxID=379896 RepID=UPI00037C0C17|nr:hypothetical protein [Paenibacillus fonticola]